MGENIEAEVIWRPYQLRPNAPQEGIPKPPNTPDNPRVGARMKAAGKAVGINFTGKCDKSPNTMLAHCLLEYVLEKYGSAAQNNPENLEKVLGSVRRNGRQVRSGVPMFVINGRAAFSGAQDPAAFHRVFDRILSLDE